MYETTPAAAISANLSLDQDAARANLGAPWRMPTDSEFKELDDNCSSVWTTMNGVAGRLFTSNVNGNILFIPAAGRYDGLSLVNPGADGSYWSSTYNSATNARRLHFSSAYLYPQDNGGRHYGFPVRPVQDGTPNRSIVSPTTVNKPKEEETPTTEEPKDDNER